MHSSRVERAADTPSTGAWSSRSGTNAMHCSGITPNRGGFRGLYLATGLLAAPFVMPTAASGDSPDPTVHADITGIRGEGGHIACAFFRSADDFPVASPRSRAVIVTAPIHDGGARCVFRDVRPGTYAIAAIHDENRNGDLDRNWLGIPTEGYGFSENASAILGAPSFHVASFAFEGGELFLTIRLQY